jgi:hypothetical protein
MNLRTFHHNDEAVYTMSLTMLDFSTGYYLLSGAGRRQLYFWLMSHTGGLWFEGRVNRMVDFTTRMSDFSESFEFDISCGINRLRVRL